MATRRMLAASISVSEQVAALRDDFTRLLFTWMIAHADDWGVLHGSPARVRAIVVPMLDCTTAQVEAALADMDAQQLIWRYEAHDGTRLIQFRTWEAHQQGLHKRTDPKLPRYCDIFPELPGTSEHFPASRARAERNLTEQNRTEEKENVRGRARGSLALSSKKDEPEPEPEPDAPAAPEPAAAAEPEPVADPDATRRSDQALYDAWVAAVGRAPRTASERRSWVNALTDLREHADLTPAGVCTLVAQYRAKLGNDRSPTPGQVAGMYSQLGASIHVFPLRSQSADGTPEQQARQSHPYSPADAERKRAALAALGIPVPQLPPAAGTPS